MDRFHDEILEIEHRDIERMAESYRRNKVSFLVSRIFDLLCDMGSYLVVAVLAFVLGMTWSVSEVLGVLAKCPDDQCVIQQLTDE